MAKVTIKIDREPDLWDYSIKEWCGGDSFDESYVINGGSNRNRDYKTFDGASWWQEAKGILYEMDYDSFPGSSLRYNKDKYTREQRKAIVKIYEDCYICDSTETIMKVVKILHPEMDLRTREIRGYCQGDWAEVVYDANKETTETLDYLEAWYFGAMSEIYCTDEDEMDCYYPVPDYMLWKWERENRVKEEVLDIFGYDADTECEIYESDGYTQVKKWKVI